MGTRPDQIPPEIIDNVTPIELAQLREELGRRYSEFAGKRAQDVIAALPGLVGDKAYLDPGALAVLATALAVTAAKLTGARAGSLKRNSKPATSVPMAAPGTVPANSVSGTEQAKDWVPDAGVDGTAEATVATPADSQPGTDQVPGSATTVDTTS